MNTIYISVILSLLCFSTFAQTLKLGDPAPELIPYEWIKGEPLNEFEKGKVYVVEFGATWCKPCIAAIPGLSRLQQKYRGDIEVVSVFVKEVNREPPGTPDPKYLQRVRDFALKQGNAIGYKLGVDGPEKKIEKDWILAAGGGGIPQTFIVNENGLVVSHLKGVSEEVLEEIIQSLLNNTFDLDAAMRKDDKALKQIKFDHYKPLFVNGNGGSSEDVSFRSLIKRSDQYIKGVRIPVVDGHGWTHVSEELQERYAEVMGTVQVVNITLSELYQMAYSDSLWNEPEIRHPVSREYVGYKNPYWKKAYGYYWHEPILEVSDTTPFTIANQWHYALKIPDSLGTAANLQYYMRQDLDRYFGYEVTVEAREMPCWYLRVREGSEKNFLPSKVPDRKYLSRKIMKNNEELILYLNRDIRDFIREIHVTKERSGIDKYPVINATDITGGFDVTFPLKRSDIMDEYDWEGYIELIDDLGLYLEKGTKSMKVVVIRDAKPQNQLKP